MLGKIFLSTYLDMLELAVLLHANGFFTRKAGLDDIYANMPSISVKRHFLAPISTLIFILFSKHHYYYLVFLSKHHHLVYKQNMFKRSQASLDVSELGTVKVQFHNQQY